MKQRRRRRKKIFGVVVFIAAAINTTVANAQFLYDFVETLGAPRVLARLELLQLPATHSEFVGLTFTSSGQDMFGLGPTYTGTFDRMVFESGKFLDDQKGGLTAIDAMGSQSTEMDDQDPPSSTLDGVMETLRFGLQASTFDDNDYIRLIYTDQAGLRRQLLRQGQWQSVPEPGSASLCCVGLVFGYTLRKRRQRNLVSA